MLWPLSWNSSPQYESINSNLLVENIRLTIKLASPIYYIQLYYCYFPLFFSFFSFFKLSVPNLVILYLSIFWTDIYLISSFLFEKIVILYLFFFFFVNIVILYLSFFWKDSYLISSFKESIKNNVDKNERPHIWKKNPKNK